MSDQEPTEEAPPASILGHFFDTPPYAVPSLIAEDPNAPVLAEDRRFLVILLMGAIMFLTGTYVGVDWVAFFYKLPNLYSAAAGMIRTCLCAFMVLLIGPCHVNARDKFWLGLGFFLTLVADVYLILINRMEIGTGLFLFVHITYIVRHSAGFRDSLAPPVRKYTLRHLALAAVLIYGGSGLLLAFVAGYLLRAGPLQFALDCVYLFVLATSLWMAWGTMIRRAFPRRNAIYIVLGMSLFYYCDVTVGVAAAITPPDPYADPLGTGLILNNLVGLFYTPALLLLAYSGFRVDAARPLSQRESNPGA